MPASRPYWKGYIKLALVSCPIGLWTATSSSDRIAFRQINKKTGNRLRQQLIDEGTREPVEAQDKGRGYEYEKNYYLMVEDEELDAIEIESNHTIDIDSFVPRSEIDERYLDSPYYIAPNDPVGAEAFAVIREAMRDKSMAALARVVLSKRERVIMLQPWGKGMLGTTVRYPYEIRNADEYFFDIPEIKIQPDLLKLAEQILKSREASFDPTRFVDRYEQAVVEMLETKRKGLPADRRPAAIAPRVPADLFEALRKSLNLELPPAKPAAKAKKAKPRVPGQTEMLLPIAGKKAAEAKAGETAKPASTPKRKAS